MGGGLFRVYRQLLYLAGGFRVTIRHDDEVQDREGSGVDMGSSMRLVFRAHDVLIVLITLVAEGQERSSMSQEKATPDRSRVALMVLWKLGQLARRA